jgi:hypothetical protein
MYLLLTTPRQFLEQVHLPNAKLLALTFTLVLLFDHNYFSYCIRIN